MLCIGVLLVVFGFTMTAVSGPMPELDLATHPDFDFDSS